MKTSKTNQEVKSTAKQEGNNNVERSIAYNP